MTMRNILLVVYCLCCLSCRSNQDGSLIKEKEELQQKLKDSLFLLEKNKVDAIREAKYLDSVSYKFEKELSLFLGLQPSRTSSVGISDTIITFNHDFSYAGYLGGKFVQIFKNDSIISLTQVFYTNGKKEGEKSFSVINTLTGENQGDLYSDGFRAIPLSLKKWNALVAMINKYNFLNLGKENCGRIVLDGTFTTITFNNDLKTHSVYRHNCPSRNFHNLAVKIDSLSPDPLNLH